MHKFYWHNNSHAAGGGSGNGGNGSNRARQQAGGSHGSSQQQTSGASLSPRVGGGGNASSSCVAGMRASDAPSVPHRNGGITVRVKTDNGGCENNDDAKSVKSHAPSGSHRVLLKLRRMSGGSSSSSRPKSVSDASEIPGSAVEVPMENPGSRMRGSRSMHQMFHYNKTWNERSLSKCLRETEQGGQHNYENIYSGDKDSGANNENNPLYENVAYHQYQYPFVSLGNHAQGENSLVIGQLTKSPRSTARSRRNQNVNNNGIFRSKSCERPKGPSINDVMQIFNIF